MRTFLAATLMFHVASSASADALRCDLSEYTANGALAAVVEQDLLTLTWSGEKGADLRLRLGIEQSQPIVRELGVRERDGTWGTLGQNLKPDFHVTSGIRRVSNQQLAPLRQLGVEITQEVMDREKWLVFWDAPLLVPGTRDWTENQVNPGLPRTRDEIREASAMFHTSSCRVKTNGRRLEVTFPGLSMGIFAGDLRFTVYRDTNLIRLEAIVKTEEPSVAYKYQGGLAGFSTDVMPRIAWRDLGGNPQQYRFGGPASSGPIALRTRNRIVIAEGQAGAVAAFPPPVTFFFAREVETNLGYNWYRRDGDGRFAENFALYNAPPGTLQPHGGLLLRQS